MNGSDGERRGNFREALDELDLALLRHILELVQEHYQLTGSFPTAAQLQALLLKPS